MYDKKHIERVLKINGMTAEASDDEIRAVLFGARYREDEVVQALRVLREEANLSVQEDIKSAQKVIRTDKSLTASEVSKLLGIDIPVDKLIRKREANDKELTGTHVAVIAVLSLMIAAVGLGLAMYAHGFGIFYE